MTDPPRRRTIEQRVVFENDRGRLREDRVQVGEHGERRLLRWDWAGPYCVAILPFDAAGDCVFVLPYRHAAARVFVEVPKGLGRVGLTPEQSAVEALRESAGLVAERLEAVGRTWPEPGLVSSTTYLFVAHGCRVAEGSDVETLSAPLPEAIRRAEAGEIADAVSTLLLLGRRGG